MPKLGSDQAEKVEKAESVGGLIEDGVYEMMLLNVEEKPGNEYPYWNWTFQFPEDAPRYPKWRQWEKTSLSPNAAWRLKAAFEAFGVTPDTDTDTLIGRKVLVHIGSETAQAGAKKGELVNVVKALLPLDPAASTTESGKVATSEEPLY